MKLESFLWRLIFALTAVVITIGSFRLGLQAFRGLFSAQLITPPFEVEYPKFSVDLSEISDNMQSLFISLDANTIADSEKPANPFQLFLEFEPENQSPIVSANENRLNGYPFLQTFVSKEISGEIRLIHRVDGQDFVVRVEKLKDLPIEGNAKGAAPVPVPEFMQKPVIPSQVQVWQWFALTALILLGAVYTGIRIAIWRRF